MIVITSLNSVARCVCPGDSFNLTITDGTGCQVVISETITEYKTIDFIASIRFALDDGTCPGFHLMGVFACRSELPKELQNAVMFEDLTPDQQERFRRSVGVSMEDREKPYDKKPAKKEAETSEPLTIKGVALKWLGKKLGVL